MSNDFVNRADLQMIRYAMVWEDEQVVSQALQINPSDDVLSICSSGDNSLALLLAGARSVTAIDISPAQAAILELKLAAIREIPYEDFLILLGMSDGDSLSIYKNIREHLPDSGRQFWDARESDFSEGLCNAGRLERYFRTFAREHVERLIPKDKLDHLLDHPFSSLEEQVAYFDTQILSEKLRAAFVPYFGQQNLQSRGRDPAQFRYVSVDDTGSEFLRRLRQLVSSVPLYANPYMHYYFRGTFLPAELLEKHGQLYLRKENYLRLRQLAPHVNIVLADVGSYLKEREIGSYNKANLSDIFEYMSVEDTRNLLTTIGQRLRSGGRIAYFNLLVERSLTTSGEIPYLRSLSEEASALHQHDRIFFYQSFHIEEVVRP